jgi:hypothetical protein
MPTVSTEGDYHVFAVVDAQEEVQETSEENNVESYFPLAVWWDSDSDGLPDWWETEMSLNTHDGTGENGADGDPDGEGLCNLDEYQAGTNPRLNDSDGDGKDDREEVIAGTDPNDENSLFAIGAIFVDGDGSNQWVTVRWQTIAGKKYQLYYQEEPGSHWIPMGPVRDGTGGAVGQTEPLESGMGMRFYHVGVE